MSERYDIVVIGAGVAGASFAARVACSSRRVLLVERAQWPRTKVCGCCLNGAAVASLRRLGLGDQLEAAGARLNRVRIFARRKTASLPVPRGIAVSRLVLDPRIVDLATDSGVEFIPGVAASVWRAEFPDLWRVELRTAKGVQSVDAGLVVAADGLCGSSLNSVDLFQPVVYPRARFGVGGIVSGARGCEESGVIAMHVAKHGYAGLVRLTTGDVNVAAAMDPDWTRAVGGPGAAVAAIVAEAGGTPVDIRNDQLRGTGLLTRRRPVVSSAGLLIIGDASGYVEPFTGEGMAWALAGAEAAAGMVNAGVTGSELSEGWARWHSSELLARQRTCALVRRLVRSPRLVSGVLSTIRAIPVAARAATTIARHIGRPYGVPAAVRTQGAAA